MYVPGHCMRTYASCSFFQLFIETTFFHQIHVNDRTNINIFLFVKKEEAKLDSSSVIYDAFRFIEYHQLCPKVNFLAI